MDYMTTWRKEIQFAMNRTGDSFDNVVACTLSDKDLDREFDSGFGSENGKRFTLWTEDWVYFPACHDGAEWAAFVPRNPCGYVTNHVGDG